MSAFVSSVPCSLAPRASFLSRSALRCSTFLSRPSSSSSALPLRRSHPGLQHLLPSPSSSPRHHSSSSPPVMTQSTTASAAAAAATPVTKYLKDYTPPFYTISHADLSFALDDDGLDTRVTSSLTIAPRDASITSCTDPLVLDGEDLDLLPDTLSINGTPLPTDAFVYDAAANTLTIAPPALPDSAGPFVVSSTVRVKPAKNTALDGLYMSAGDYCTQCEAEGFRRITFYIDRPDVMATFDVRVEADKTKYPVLLSNGNCVEKGDAQDDGKHWAKFKDPFPKPCYLFALVAGDLDAVKDTFTTMGGRKVDLSVYVKGKEEVKKCGHAMESLKKAMKWDEDTYGLEYNYDIFNIVAVPSFVFGAMENTSLNIFNSKYVLVSPETATDTDFNNVEGVVAHEYFHNYSGNRVTCSSWFQLSLKEGLTVFRDQSFSADMNSAAVKRISDVQILRAHQFAEDAGPLSHPIQPKSYVTCNTFYTATVYNKGAEVIRMLKTIVGPAGYRAGTDIYFARHDGQAVTCDDWIKAIADANPHIDLSVFKNWYDTSGTPVVKVNVMHDPANRTLTLVCNQSIKPTTKQPESQPLFIPIRVGLIAPDGSPVPVDLGDGEPADLNKVLKFDTRDATFVLHNVPDNCVPSLLRDFSAPIKLEREDVVPPEQLAFLMANDTDHFNQWEAGQKLMLDFILQCVHASSDFDPLPEVIISAFRKTLNNDAIDAALRSLVFTPPAESYVLEQVTDADPARIRAAVSHLKSELATHLETDLTKVVSATAASAETYSLSPAAQGERSLRNVALSYLASLQKPATLDLCLDVVRSASNMTDALAAMRCLASAAGTEQRTAALAEFYDKWQDDQLVVDKWLLMQSTAKVEDIVAQVEALREHKAYKESIPNCVYALLGGFGAWNVHMPTDGSGYKLLADQVIALNKLNAQVAARIARPFTGWRKFDAKRREQMEEQLKRIRDIDHLSKDVYEIVSNCLASA